MCTVHSPSIYAEKIYGLKLDGQTRVYDGKFAVFAREYYNPKHYATGDIIKTDKMRAIHHYASTWHNLFEKIMRDLGVFFIRLLGYRLYSIFELCYHKILTRKIYRSLRKVVK